MIVLVYCIPSLFNCMIFVMYQAYMMYTILLWHDVAAYLC